MDINTKLTKFWQSLIKKIIEFSLLVDIVTAENNKAYQSFFNLLSLFHMSKLT